MQGQWAGAVGRGSGQGQWAGAVGRGSGQGQWAGAVGRSREQEVGAAGNVTVNGIRPMQN